MTDEGIPDDAEVYVGMCSRCRKVTLIEVTTPGDMGAGAARMQKWLNDKCFGCGGNTGKAYSQGIQSEIRHGLIEAGVEWLGK